MLGGERATELEERDWDDLPPQLRAAAQTLGYDKKLWDSDVDPPSCGREWCELTEEEQDAATLLGYTCRRWDEEDDALSDACDDATSDADDDGGACNNEAASSAEGRIAALEGRIAKLEDELRRRRGELRTLLDDQGGGTADGTPVLEGSRCEEPASSSPPERGRGHAKEPAPKSPPGPLPTRDLLLSEVRLASSSAASLLVHCVLYINLNLAMNQINNGGFEFVSSYFSPGWHIISNNFDDTSERHVFSAFAVAFSLFLARTTGMLYEFNESPEFRARLDAHLERRWEGRRWDLRPMDWFAGGELREEYGDDGSPKDTDEKDEGGEKDAGAKGEAGRGWGPRLKLVVDVFAFFLCYSSVEHFLEKGARAGLSVKDDVLEGLPSRGLASRGWAECTADDGGEGACPSEGEGEEYQSEIWSWVTRLDRCGWRLKGDDEEDDGGDDGEGDRPPDGAEKAAGTFKPWRGSDDPVRREMGVLDDAYLRSRLSQESYEQIVGDPYAVFMCPRRERWYFAATIGMGLWCLHWMGAPFLLV